MKNFHFLSICYSELPKVTFIEGKRGLPDEKSVILTLLRGLESWERWQMNHQTCTLKVKKFQLSPPAKIVNQRTFSEGGMEFIPPRGL